MMKPILFKIYSNNGCFAGIDRVGAKPQPYLFQRKLYSVPLYSGVKICYISIREHV